MYDARRDKLPQHEKKRKKPVAVTARTLKHLRGKGFIAEVTEKWIPFTRIRKDVFGFGDVLCIDDRPGSLLVQVTSESGGKVADRKNKIVTACAVAARRWLERGNRIEVHGWGKKGGRGERKLWTLRIVPVTLADLTIPL